MPFNKKHHYKLFVDINGTIMSADKARNKDEESANYEMVAENIKAKWLSSMDQPITYREFVDGYILPGDLNDPFIKDKRMQAYKNVLSDSKALDTKLYNEAADFYLKLQTAQVSDNKIFSSFIALLDHLRTKELKYSIVLRTFGEDLAKAEHELERRSSLRFSHHYTFPAMDQPTQELQKLLTSITPQTHGGWQDSYPRWKAKGFKHIGGKQHSIDLNDSETISIFFDDNIKDKKIVGINLLGYNLDPAIDPEIFQSFLQPVLIEMGLLVPVNTAQAIINQDYFVKALEKVANFDLQMLKDALPQIAEKAKEATFVKFANNKNTFFIQPTPSVVLDRQVDSQLSLHP